MAAIVVSHGYGADDQSIWLPYLRGALEELGHDVHIPRLPNSSDPDARAWRGVLAERVAGLSAVDTVLVGHSIGAVNVLRVLEGHEGGAFAGVVLVAAPAWLPPGYESLAGFFAEPFDWPALRRAARHYRVLTALDDPVLMPRPVDHVAELVSGLGATAVVTAAGAHFGATPDDHIELPRAVRLVLECLADEPDVTASLVVQDLGDR
ncbi:alpha/beta hydrolase [Dactylosporangium darangshiense]|uniref:Alpha/beta hydrolase n=1 Tax=Dactylosporangium darangshiense TaxID=579108 RepID=A0ABP8D640_9ACTN